MARSDTIHPLIGVNADLKDSNGFDMLAAGYKYVASVVEASQAVAVMVPTMGDIEFGGDYPVDSLLDRLDGMVLTGGRSNVEPHHYGGEPFRPETMRDPLRDASTLSIARKAIERGVPLFGICRGIQEINVALGGSLHPYLWEVEGHDDRGGPVRRYRPGCRHRRPGGHRELATRSGRKPGRRWAGGRSAQC
jgi:putative glutamine amidotransferase